MSVSIEIEVIRSFSMETRKNEINDSILEVSLFPLPHPLQERAFYEAILGASLVVALVHATLSHAFVTHTN